MKKLSAQYMIGLLGIILSGCSRVENIEQLNNPPEIIFNDSIRTFMLKDSIKLSLKHSQRYYAISLKIDDPNKNISDLNYELLTGNGVLFQDNQKLDGGSIRLNSNEVLSLSYEPSEFGIHTLRLNAIDNFGLKTEATLELTAFNNLPPVTRFEVRIPDYPNDILERIIDATGSFDQDLRFGGALTEFEFIVLGKTIRTDKSKIPIIFPALGNYEISVRVMDNDGELSIVETESILME